jgi:hypothetical protein
MKNWNKDKDLECLLFFAQRSRELLFDYTLDTFKPPALNSLAVCQEALDIIDDIENEIISKHSIEPILRELNWKISNDYVFKHLAGERLEQYLPSNYDGTNLKAIETNLRLLLKRVKPRNYAEECQKQLKELITENRQKRKIDKILTAYISSLIDFGYSQGFLYSTINKHFYTESVQITSVNQLDDFFNELKIQYKKYDVIFKCSSIFKEIKDSSNVFGCEIVETPALRTTEPKEKGFFKKWKSLYVVCSKVEALDPLKAKEVVEEKLNNLAKLFIFFHHKKQPFWPTEAIIYQTDNASEYVILKGATSYMKKTNDLSPSKAGRKLNQLMDEFRFDRNSFSKFDRAIDLHGTAIENQRVENQLLHNWIAFETLLVGYSTKSKIDQVLESLVPFLKLNYTRRLAEYVSKLFIWYNQALFRESIKNVDEGEDVVEKFIAFACLEKYKTQRLDLYSKLDDHPLLKYRIFLLNKFFKTGKEISNFIEIHELKITWQIKRMYRSRNLIVHAGQVPDFTPFLVENSHSYLDLLLNTMINLSLEKRIGNIEEAIQEVNLICQFHSKTLKNHTGEVDENNFLKIIFNI